MGEELPVGGHIEPGLDVDVGHQASGQAQGVHLGVGHEHDRALDGLAVDETAVVDEAAAALRVPDVEAALGEREGQSVVVLGIERFVPTEHEGLGAELVAMGEHRVSEAVDEPPLEEPVRRGERVRRTVEHRVQPCRHDNRQERERGERREDRATASEPRAPREIDDAQPQHQPGEEGNYEGPVVEDEAVLLRPHRYLGAGDESGQRRHAHHGGEGRSAGEGAPPLSAQPGDCRRDRRRGQPTNRRHGDGERPAGQSGVAQQRRQAERVDHLPDRRAGAQLLASRPGEPEEAGQVAVGGEHLLKQYRRPQHQTHQRRPAAPPCPLAAHLSLPPPMATPQGQGDAHRRGRAQHKAGRDHREVLLHCEGHHRDGEWE